MATKAKTLGRGFIGDRLEADLRAFVRQAEAHQPLTSERQLAKEYDISYGTVRRVITGLVDAGLIYKEHGRGAFVAPTAGAANEAITGTVLYVDDWGESGHPFCLRKLQGILDVAMESEFRVQVMRVQDFKDWQAHPRFLQEATQDDVVGVILPWLTSELYRVLKDRSPGLMMVSFHDLQGYPDTAGVKHEPAVFGRMIIDYFTDVGVKSLLLLHKDKRLLHSAEAQLRSAKAKIKILNQPWANGDPLDETIALLRRTRAKGVFFPDDRLTLAVYNHFRDADPRWLEKHVLLTMANAGENILPPEIARIDMDGYDVGSMAMMMLKSLLSGNQEAGPIAYLEPRFRRPNHE